MKLTPKVLAVILVAAALLVAGGGWFGFVAPQRSKLSSLDQQIAQEEATLRIEQDLAKPKPIKKSKANALKKQALRELDAAMPKQPQMASVLRQVQKAAATSSITLDSFVPSVGTAEAGYASIPIDIGVTGRYASIQRFVGALRKQATSRNGRVEATGRLFDVKSLGLAPGDAGAPQLKGTIRLSTFVYTGVTPVAEGTETDESTEGEVTP